MGYILAGTIIGGIIWGIVVNKVIENKGYEENWFWWGFFFGIFALIIALTKQSVNTTKVVIESSAPIKDDMELLSSCTLNNKVNVSSPVHIASWEIKKDSEKLVLFVDFINVSQKAISAVMFSATGLNSFGDIVRVNDTDFFDMMGQDLSIKPDECGKVYTTLQDDAIRKVEIKVKKICFADGTIVDDIQDEWVNTNQFELNSIHIDCAKRENAQSKFYAIAKELYWQCVCGFVNTQNTCTICGMQKNNAIKYTQDNIDGTYNEYIKQTEIERVEEEKRKLEEKRLQEEKARMIKKRAMKISIITLISIVIVSALSIMLTPLIKYNKAISLYKNNNITLSKDLFSSIQGYKDADEWLIFFDILQLEESGYLNEASMQLNSIKNTKFAENNPELIQEHIALCEQYKLYCGKWEVTQISSNNVGFEEGEYNSLLYIKVKIKNNEVLLNLDNSMLYHDQNEDVNFPDNYTYINEFESIGGKHVFKYTFDENTSMLTVKHTKTVTDGYNLLGQQGWRIDETVYYELTEKY